MSKETDQSILDKIKRENMRQPLNIEIHGSHGKAIKDRPTVDAATTDISFVKADYSKLAKQDEDLTVEVEIETELNKSELVIVWLFMAVLVTLTVVASYLLWQKVSLTF